MLGLFQADLPFGRRFWLLFVIVMLFAFFDQGVLRSVPDDPLRLALEALVLFGFSTGINIVADIGLILVYHLLVRPIRERKQRLEYDDAVVRYILEHRYYEGRLAKLALQGTFLVGVILGLLFYQSFWVRIGGIVGLVITLVWIIASTEARPGSDDDLLKLTWLGDGMSFALRLNGTLEDLTVNCVEHLEDTIVELVSAGWRPVNVLEPSPERQLLFFTREHDYEGALVFHSSLLAIGRRHPTKPVNPGRSWRRLVQR